MNTDEIRSLLDSAGHGAHADAVLALAQPNIKITASALAPRPEGFRQTLDEVPDPGPIAEMDAALEALPLGESRFGGVPDLPPGAGWPERDGVPMEFIAQVRLADVAAHDSASRLPPSGTLLFFQNSQWTTSDEEPDAPCCAVIFYEGPDSELMRVPPPRVEWKSEFVDVTQIAPMIHGMAALEFAAGTAFPGGLSPFIQEPLSDFWQDFQGEHCEAFSGGCEPNMANYLLGYVDEQDYVDAHANGTEDQLLFQVDSCGEADFQFGDCQKLFFLMTKTELAARDFSRVRLYSILG